MRNSKICLVSGHYPSSVPYARMARHSISEYAKSQSYGFYYDGKTYAGDSASDLHFRRCVILQKARGACPNADWYVWLDTDIFVHRSDKRIEECLDLGRDKILYHLFHEAPWGYAVNTGVKIVHKSAIPWEAEIHARREGCPYPFEQKVVIDYILTEYHDRVLVHDPHELNCIYGLHDASGAVFVHVCGRGEQERNRIMFDALKEQFGARKLVFFLMVRMSDVKELVRKRIRSMLRMLLPDRVYGWMSGVFRVMVGSRHRGRPA